MESQEPLPLPGTESIELEMVRPGENPVGYDEFLTELQKRVAASQLRAALSVNRELVLLYWQIGHDILERQRAQGWGAKVIDRLSVDLKNAFPEVNGFSVRNLKSMRAFAEAYPEHSFVHQVAAQVSWYHNVTLLDKVKDSAQREWYTRATIQNGWSRNVLVHQIESGLYRRQGKAVTNFTRTLPAPQSDLAHQLLKDPYNFDFLTLGDAVEEREVERGLLEQIRRTLLELGAGFAFVGSQYHLEVGGQDFYLDLLFFHLRLRCFVVVDLKIGDFKPEYAGKMNFYLAVADDKLKHPTLDQPSIGLILCKTNNRIIAEYTLRDASRPIGVAEYQVGPLPEDLQNNLPSLQALENALQNASEKAGRKTTASRKTAPTRRVRRKSAGTDSTPD